MDISAGLVEAETDPTFTDVDLTPILIASMIIAAGAFLIRGRTPAYVAVVFFWPAVFLGAYLILLVGFSWPLILIILMIVLSAISIWKLFKDERASPYIAGVAVIGLVLFVVLFLGGGTEAGIPVDIGDNGEIPSIPWDDPGGYIETAFGGFGTFILIILIGGIVAFLLAQKVIPFMKSSPEREEEEKGLEDQLSSTMDQAVTELRQGKDVHSTILRCYQRMCLILEEKGAKNFKFMTPREFEKQALRTLDVSTSKITEIREVFELAKYSGYELGEKERKKALNALKELRNELEGYDDKF